jgi:hypothetical protein
VGVKGEPLKKLIEYLKKHNRGNDVVALMLVVIVVLALYIGAGVLLNLDRQPKAYPAPKKITVYVVVDPTGEVGRVERREY